MKKTLLIFLMVILGGISFAEEVNYEALSKKELIEIIKSYESSIKEEENAELISDSIVNKWIGFYKYFDKSIKDGYSSKLKYSELIPFIEFKELRVKDEYFVIFAFIEPSQIFDEVYNNLTLIYNGCANQRSLARMNFLLNLFESSSFVLPPDSENSEIFYKKEYGNLESEIMPAGKKVNEN